MSTLTGAARNARDVTVLMDTARARTTDRDTLAPADVEALLRSVYALTPANRRRKLDEEGAQILEKGQVRGRLKATLTRTSDLSVFSGALLGHSVDEDAVDFSPYYVDDDETPWIHGAPDLRGVEAVATRYTGHGIGHQYRPDVAR